MKFSATLTALLSIASAVLAESEYLVTYDFLYDDGAESLGVVACSTGTYGLESQGYTNFSSLPDPFIGGAVAIAGYDSPNCGTCWNLTYPATGKHIYLIAVDHASPGFNIGFNAMNNLTKGLAEQLGVINVTAQEVAKPNCGLPS